MASLHAWGLLDQIPYDQMLERIVFRQFQLVIINTLTILVVGVVAEGEAGYLRVRLLIQIQLLSVIEVCCDFKSLQLVHQRKIDSLQVLCWQLQN